jgi:hypothetical protein
MTITVGQIGQIGQASGVSSSYPTGAVNTSATGSGFIIACAAIQGSGSSTTWTVTDNFSNSYTQLAQDKYVSGGATYSFDRFYCANGGGGTGHIATATASNTPTAFVVLIELKNAALSSLYGASNATTYPFSAASPYSSTLVLSPPATGIFLLGGLGVSGSATPTITESTGFTVIGQENSASGGGTAVAWAYRVITSSGTLGPNFSSTSGVEAYVSVDSFLGPAGGLTAPLAWIT